MRAPAASEIVLLARVLTRLAPEDRHFMASSILAETDEAERHLRLTGHAHPTFGDGSLMTRCALLSPPPEPFADDPAFLACLALAANALLIHSGA
jgi:hypothetical protein